MADEDDAGANYLAALRQSTTPQGVGAAPARAQIPRSADAQTGPIITAGSTNSGNADKRQSRRYKCAGSARIQEIGNTVATWATLADISMHGCYVETTSPLRVRTLLRLKLDANGFRIETTGEVRVIYPGLGMGISFTKMSDGDCWRLRELMRSISRPSVILSPRVAPRPSSPPTPQSGASPAVANPAAALQAILKFFENRHDMGREEFLRILRLNQ